MGDICLNLPKLENYVGQAMLYITCIFPKINNVCAIGFVFDFGQRSE